MNDVNYEELEDIAAEIFDLSEEFADLVERYGKVLKDAKTTDEELDHLMNVGMTFETTKRHLYLSVDEIEDYLNEYCD